MSEEFHSIELSLREYLSEAGARNRSGANDLFHKYNNLKIFMNPKQESTPHIIVRIGISEAVYNINNGELLSGSLGPEENMVKRWLDRNIYKLGLDKIWTKEKNATSESG